MPERHDDETATGRSPRPADSVASKLKTPRFLESATVKLGHAFGEGLDDLARRRSRQHLRHVGWERALDASQLGFAHGSFPARQGNRLDVLVDGSEALPAIAAELASAESYVHLTGWFFSPELHLSRDDEPTIVRNLLAELAERIDVRVLSWKGAPVPVFKPSQRDVREMLDALARHTKIEAHADGCTGFTHCHHEKTIVIDGRVAFVGGIDLTLDGGDPWDTPSHVARGGIGWHDAAVRLEGPVGRRRRAALPAALARRDGQDVAAARGARPGRRRRGADREDASRGHVPRRAARGLLDPRVVLGCASVRGAVHLPREPVPLVAGDRRDPRRQAAQPAERRLSAARAPACARERRRRHLARPGGSAHPCGRRDDPIPRVHDLRTGREASRSRVRPLEDRDRRRSLAHDRLGEPERALALQRHRDERRHARSRDCSSDAAPPVVRAPGAAARGRPGRPDRADRRAVGAHRVGAARAPRGRAGA